MSTIQFIALSIFGLIVNIVLIIPFILLIWRFVIRPMIYPNPIRKYKYKDCYAIVTGASEGVGRSYAKYLAKEGFNLIIIARRKELLNSLKEEIENEYHIKVIIIDVDLCDDNNFKRIEEEMKDKNITVLVNNAGKSIHDYFEKFEISEINKVIKLNISATNMMTRLFIENTKQFVNTHKH